jgi:fructokinase
MARVYGAIEGGGTKFVCAVATGPHNIIARVRLDTRTPDVTIPDAIAFVREASQGHDLAAIGVACFGPIELDQSASDYGSVTTTVKPGWAHTPILGPLREAFGVPVGFDTDVNGAALGEVRWGAAQGCDPAVYVTVGTGIGGGVIVNGAPLHGLMHPEIGHLPIPRLPLSDGRLDDFPGVCAYHGGLCFEGLASGPAVGARAGRPAEDVPDDDPLWELEAGYLAVGLATIVCTLSPRRIVVGGGVMHRGDVLRRTRERLRDVLAGYVGRPEVTVPNGEYVVAPHFGQDAGLIGAIALAEAAEAASR